MKPPHHSQETAPKLSSEDQDICRLIKRLSPFTPLRRYVERWFQGEPIPHTTFADLLKVLEAPKDFLWKERIVSAWLLIRMPLSPQQKSVVAQVLQEIVRTTRQHDDERMDQFLKWSITCGLVLFILLFVFWLTGKPDSSFLGLWFWTAFPMALVFCCLGSIVCGVGIAGLVLTPAYNVWSDQRHIQVRAAAASALGRFCLPESADCLASAACEQSRFVVDVRPLRQAAMAVLPAVLGSLREENYGRHHPGFVSDLCRLLYQADPNLEGLLQPPDEELVLAILEALGKVGDGRAVVPVQRLAQRARIERIRSAAKTILPVLEQRRRQENDPKVLLRASSENGTPSDVLLRPAASTTETEPQQLLRASAAEEHNVP